MSAGCIIFAACAWLQVMHFCRQHCNQNTQLLLARPVIKSIGSSNPGARYWQYFSHTCLKSSACAVLCSGPPAGGSYEARCDASFKWQFANNCAGRSSCTTLPEPNPPGPFSGGWVPWCVGLADGESCLAGSCAGTPWTAECSNGTWLVKPGFCRDVCSLPNGALVDNVINGEPASGALVGCFCDCTVVFMSCTLCSVHWCISGVTSLNVDALTIDHAWYRHSLIQPKYSQRGCSFCCRHCTL
jgi:hypothetical protein